MLIFYSNLQCKIARAPEDVKFIGPLRLWVVEEKISKVYKIKFIVIRVKMQPITEKFCFRTVTLKELYDTIDYLYSIKIPGPGIFNAWAIKAAKFAIET